METIRNFLAVALALSLACTSFSAQGQKKQTPLKLSTVVIDPGHGGKDAGCSSPDGKTLEKTIVLDISKRLAEKIREGYPDVKVVMTRNNDSFVELQGRADIANRNKANLFISIHVNSVEGKRSGPNGYSIHILGQYNSKNKDLYAGNMDVVRRENSVITLEDDYSAKYEGFNPADEESYIFMNLMQNAFLEQSLEFAQKIDESLDGKAVKNSRGVSQDPFLVLWRTAMPSVLIECGFMCNPDDRAVLASEEGREKVASGIYEGFKKYKKGYDGSVALEPKKPAKVETAGTGKEEAKASEVKEVKEAKEVNAGQDKVLYGVQVLVTSKEMPSKDPYFLGYEPKKFNAGRFFKYVIGTSENLEEARSNLKKIREKYPDSYLVKIEENQVSAYK